MYEVVNSYFTKMITEELYKPIIVYWAWASMHYLAVHAYSYYCTNWSIWGYITSPFVTTSPLCKGLNWFIYESSNTLSNIFVLVGTTASLYLMKFKVNNKASDCEPS